MKQTVTFFAAALSAAVIFAAGSVPAAAKGPVATACKEDIPKFCSGKSHNGSIRACLEENKDKVSAGCKAALESTGPGKGMGKRKGQGNTPSN